MRRKKLQGWKRVEARKMDRPARRKLSFLELALMTVGLGAVACGYEYYSA